MAMKGGSGIRRMVNVGHCCVLFSYHFFIREETSTALTPLPELRSVVTGQGWTKR